MLFTGVSLGSGMHKQCQHDSYLSVYIYIGVQDKVNAPITCACQHVPCTPVAADDVL